MELQMVVEKEINERQKEDGKGIYNGFRCVFIEILIIVAMLQDKCNWN